MITVNAIGATWVILMFLVMGAICIKHSDDFDVMPSFSCFGFKKKVATYLLSVLLVGGLPWLLAVLLFKSFVFGW